jgi:hypothetical protein
MPGISVTACAVTVTLLLAASVSAVMAQEPTPDTRPRDDQGRPIDVCAVEPARLISGALASPTLAIAFVEVLTPYEEGAGVELAAVHVIDGAMPETATTDLPRTRGCVDLYDATGVLTLSVLFVASDGSYIRTFQAWEVRSPGGEALTASDVDATTAFNELQVLLPNDQIMTVDELLAAGRAYVAPTPTPYPPGVPTVPPFVDTASTPVASRGTPSGIVAPDTGGGGGGTGVVAGLSLLALIALAGGVGVVALAAARRR